jgi:hypothetical protein
LSDFLDGESASAIVTLGKEAIHAKDEEARLVQEIAKLRDEGKEATKQQKAAADKVDQLARDVQDRIVSQLKALDYAHFTKNRYSVNKIRDDLRNHMGEFADSNAHAEALKRLGEGAPSLVPNIAAPPIGVSSHLIGLSELLTEKPTRVAIQALEGNPTAQTWVEQGFALHEGWASSGLTDIHHQGLRPGRKDVHHGDHGAEAASPPVVHAGVQGGDRGAVPGR